MKLVVMGSVIIKMEIQGREISSEIIFAMRNAGSNSIIREIIDNYYKEKKWKEEAERKKKIVDDIIFIRNFSGLGETKNVQTNNKD